jgi:prepilin-type N-terminal cleavage/methylation domain-containing protein
MPKASYQKAAFTLIEVMISVLIISLVVMALYSMRSNGTFLMQKATQKSLVQNYQTFFLSHTNYGFIKEEITLDKLLDGFDVEDNLRRRLKNKKLSILYTQTDAIDANETSLELGITSLKMDTITTSFFRLQAL